MALLSSMPSANRRRFIQTNQSRPSRFALFVQISAPLPPPCCGFGTIAEGQICRTVRGAAQGLYIFLRPAVVYWMQSMREKVE
nr:hypothetical protein [uncultured Agathobaculum sp.]